MVSGDGSFGEMRCGGEAMLKGTLAVNEIEGRHFEFEVEVDGRKEIYVLIPIDDAVERALAAGVGRQVRVSGHFHDGPNLFMRGPVVRVTEVRPA